MQQLPGIPIGDCKKLEKVQRRAARLVKRDYTNHDIGVFSHFSTWLANPL